VGGVDHIYTNSQDDVTVLASWMLKNDSDPDAGPSPLSITNVAENTNMIADLNDSGLPTSFLFNLSGANTSNGSVADFNYDVTDGAATTNVAAQIHLDTSGAIDGGATNDIVIGGSANETLIGNGGADFLIGGGGNDTLVFDAADHLVDGGSGFDRAQTTASFTFDNVGVDAKFTGVEMVDLGDSNHNSDRTVVLNVADVLGTTNVTVNVNGTNHNIDLFVIGDNSNGTTDNVDLNGFTQVDVNGGSPGNGTFNYTDAVTGAAHTYTLWQSADTTVKIAIESGLDVI